MLWSPDPRMGAPKTQPHLPLDLPSLALGSVSSLGKSEAARLGFRARTGLGIKVKVRLDSALGHVLG